MDRLKQKALHQGRESVKFTFEICALEASGLPQALLSTTTGEIALTLQRGVKAVRSQPARATAGVARWLGDAGATCLVVTLYKSNDKSGTGKAFSSKPYRVSLVAQGAATASKSRLPGRVGVELGSADLDLSRLAPPGALLSPPTNLSAATREFEIDLPTRSGGAARLRLCVRVLIANPNQSSNSQAQPTAGLGAARPAFPPTRGAGGGGDRDSEDDAVSVSSRLAHLNVGYGGAARAGGGGARDSTGFEPRNRGYPDDDDDDEAEAPRARAGNNVAGLSEMRDGLEAELNRRRLQREASTLTTPKRSSSNLGRDTPAGAGTPAAVLASAHASEALRLRDEKAALTAELDALRAAFERVSTRAADAEQRATAAEAAESSADARSAEEAAAAAEMAVADATARAARAERALLAAREDADDLRAALEAESDRRAAADADAQAARAEARDARAAAERERAAPSSAAAAHAARADAEAATAENLRTELGQLRLEWNDALTRVSASSQLKLDRLVAAKAALEAREGELSRELAAARDEALRERRRADDALTALGATRDALAASQCARDMAEAEEAAAASARAEAARALQGCRAELAETSAALADAEEALAEARAAPQPADARAARVRNGVGDGDDDDDDVRIAASDDDSSDCEQRGADEPADDEATALARARTTDGGAGGGRDACVSPIAAAASFARENDERDERLIELTLELVEAKMKCARRAALLRAPPRARGALTPPRAPVRPRRGAGWPRPTRSSTAQSTRRASSQRGCRRRRAAGTRRASSSRSSSPSSRCRTRSCRPSSTSSEAASARSDHGRPSDVSRTSRH
jgi:hypothetical protein